MGIDTSMLVQFTFKGDFKGFLAAWDYTLMGLVKQPMDTQLRKCNRLGPAFVVYDGAQEGAKEQSFQLLFYANN